MVQGGDPTGTGKGGQSIYGGYFDDEFVSTLKHERRGCLSMVNTGPNTNGSAWPKASGNALADECARNTERHLGPHVFD